MKRLFSYLKRRASQGTTWIGIAAIIISVSTGTPVTPETLTGVLAGLGLIHVDS